MAHTTTDSSALEQHPQTACVDDIYFNLGLDYASGRTMPRDLINAHKFFNLAAMRGNREAILHRKEISLEMSKEEIATALHCARDFLHAEAQAATIH